MPSVDSTVATKKPPLEQTAGTELLHQRTKLFPFQYWNSGQYRINGDQVAPILIQFKQTLTIKKANQKKGHENPM